MKKKSLCMILLLLLCMLTGCKNDSGDKISLKDLGIDTSDGELMNYIDTHGAMGDGSTYIEIEFHGEEVQKMENDMRNNESWKQLPLSDTLRAAVYGNEYRESLVTCFDEEIPAIPEINSGYYYFYDRHRESTDAGDDTNLFGRYSFNFDIILYDLKKHRLYVYQLDT